MKERQEKKKKRKRKKRGRHCTGKQTGPTLYWQATRPTPYWQAKAHEVRQGFLLKNTRVRRGELCDNDFGTRTHWEKTDKRAKVSLTNENPKIRSQKFFRPQRARPQPPCQKTRAKKGRNSVKKGDVLREKNL